RGNRHIKEAGGDKDLAQKLRLFEWFYCQGTIYQNNSFSMMEHTSVTSTGWHGTNPPKW
ncbi:hypothetical protein K443DRAFT_37215, partial [Laccaria amethystina LaAM-08-1]